MNYIDGKMIRSLRETRNMTQAELGEKLGVTDKTVSKWETGRGLPDITILPELAGCLGVSVVELMAGETISNDNVSANMKKTRFYVCPVCGNIIQAVGQGLIACHGITLPPQEAEEAGDIMTVACLENDYVVTIESPMRKDDYVSFAAYVSSDSTQLVRLYPEQEPMARFMRKGHGVIYAYDVRRGLYQKKV